MKKKILTQIVLNLVLPLIIIEIILRIVPVVNRFYLSKTDLFYLARNDSTVMTPYYFIGSSHVAVGVNTQVINSQLNSKNIIAFNAGRGYSTGTVFYLALKNLAKEGLLENAKVFLEAPRGLPYYYEGKNGEWVNDANVHLIIPYLDFKTFIDFWRFSSNNLSTKINLSVNYMSYFYRTCTLIREIIQRNSMSDIINKLGVVSNFHTQKTDHQSISDLSENGGVKSDPVSIAHARKLAHEYFSKLAEELRIINLADWKESRLNDIIELLNDHDCELILFDIPISSVEALTFQTDIALQNILGSIRYLESHNTKYINCSMLKYTDEDFPDLWHLSEAKSVEYSELLLQEITN